MQKLNLPRSGSRLVESRWNLRVYRRRHGLLLIPTWHVKLPMFLKKPPYSRSMATATIRPFYWFRKRVCRTSPRCSSDSRPPIFSATGRFLPENNGQPSSRLGLRKMRAWPRCRPRCPGKTRPGKRDPIRPLCRFLHAFGCLEQAVREAIDDGHDKDANYRLLGRKADSLGSLLDRVASEDKVDADVDHYVLFLCARQPVKRFNETTQTIGRNTAQTPNRFLRNLGTWTHCRKRLIERDSDHSESGSFESFLQWFERWFLRRAKPVEEVEE